MTTFSNNEAHPGAYIVYINGIEVPTKSVSLRFGVWQIPEMVVEMVADPVLSRLGAEDRVQVAVFYLDDTSVDASVPSAFRLFGEGEITGWGYQNTPSGRSINFTVVNQIAVWTQLFVQFLTTLDDMIGHATFAGAGVVDTGVPSSEIVFPFSLFKQGLVPTPATVASTAAAFSSAAGQQRFRLAAENITEVPSDIVRPFDFLYNVVRNMIGVNVPRDQRTVPAANFFTRWVRLTNFHNRFVGLPFFDDTANKNIFPVLSALQDVSAIDIIAKSLIPQVQNSGSLWDMLQLVYQTMFMEIAMIPGMPLVSVDLKTSLIQPTDFAKHTLSGTVTAASALSFVEGAAPSGQRYVSTIPSDSRKLTPLRIPNYFAKPQMLFGLPPSCNVIFPSTLKMLAYDENYATQPTRLYFNDETLPKILKMQGGSIGTTVQNVLTSGYPPAADAAEVARVTTHGALNGKNFLLFPEEFFKGPVMDRRAIPSWLYFLKQGEQPKGKTSDGSVPATPKPAQTQTRTVKQMPAAAATAAATPPTGTPSQDAVARLVVLRQQAGQLGRPVFTSTIDSRTGTVTDDPFTLAAQAGVDIETYTAARLAVSEGYSKYGDQPGDDLAATCAMIAIVQMKVRRSRNGHFGTTHPLFTMLTDAIAPGGADFSGSGANYFGPQDGSGGNRNAATSKDPSPWHIALAKAVLNGEVPDNTKGATSFFDPASQNKGFQNGIALPTSTAFLMKQDREDKLSWIGPVENIDSYNLMMLALQKDPAVRADILPKAIAAATPKGAAQTAVPGPVVDPTAVTQTSPASPVTSAQVGAAQDENPSVYQLYAKYEYFRERYAKRSGSAVLAWNPYVVAGFPTAIFDQRATRVDLFAYVTTVQQKMTHRSRETTLSFVYGRTVQEMFSLLAQDFANGAAVACTSPLEAVRDIRKVIQDFDQAEQLYQKLFYGGQALYGKAASFDWRTIIGYAPDIAGQPPLNIFIDGPHEASQDTVVAATKTIAELGQTRADVQTEIDTKNTELLGLKAQLASIGSQSTLDSVEAQNLSVQAAQLAQVIYGLQAKRQNLDNQLSKAASIVATALETTQLRQVIHNLVGDREIVPLLSAVPLFKDYDAAMVYNWRPICTLDEYIIFYDSAGEGRIDAFNHPRAAGAPYYDRIRRFTPLTPTSPLPAGADGLGTTPGAQVPGLSDVNFAQTRADWDLALLAFKNNVNSVKAPRT